MDNVNGRKDRKMHRSTWYVCSICSDVVYSTIRAYVHSYSHRTQLIAENRWTGKDQTNG